MNLARPVRLLLVAAVAAVTVALAVPAFGVTGTISGRILMPDGSAAVGGVGFDDPNSTSGTWTELAPDGSFTVDANVGATHLFGVFEAPQPSDSSFGIELLSDEFELDEAGTVITMTLPRVAAVHAHVVDEDGQPVLDARVARGTNEASGALNGTTDQGLSLIMGGGSHAVQTDLPVDSHGLARVPALLGGEGLELTASAEGRNSVAVTTNVPIDPTDVTITMGDRLPPLVVATDSLPAGIAGAPYLATLAGTGGTSPYTWSLAGGSALPAGLSLSPSGVISGTPTVPTGTGGASVSVRLADSSSPVMVTTKTLTIRVEPGPPTITTTNLATSRVGVSYSQRLEGTGGRSPYSWSVVGGSLPAGLGLSTTGFITGTPSAATEGTSVEVRLIDASAPALVVTKTLTLRVEPAFPVVTTTNLAKGQVGVPYSQSLQGSGGRTPYSWSLIGGALPAGLSLSSVGVVSGTPTTEQTTSFRVQLRDASSPAVLATRDLTITVATVAVTTATLADAVVGKAYAATLTASGGTPGYTWSVVSGSLPTGLTLSSLGKITGTPRATGTATFTVRVQDTSKPVKKVGTREFTLTVGPMTVADTSLPRGLAGKAYPATTLKTVGGKAGFTWTVISGSLPSGLKLSTTGTISGTAVGPGASSFTVRVADASVPKNYATRAFTIVVDPMTITTASLPNGTVKTLYTNQTLKALGGKGTLTWAVASGALPPGMRLSSGGLVSGTPTAAGTYTFTVRVSDTSVPKNVATRTLTLTVV